MSNLKTYATPERLPQFGSLSTILRILGSGHDVLDVGCSQGYLGRYDNGRNRFWGVDGNPAALEVARQYYVDVACAELNSSEADWFSGKRFDVVVFADVLEHLLSPEKMLERAASLLRENGRIIVSLPNVALWRVRLNLLFGSFNYTKYGVLDDSHLHLYTFASAQRLVERCGYRILDTVGAANELGFIAQKVKPLRTLASINVILTAKPK